MNKYITLSYEFEDMPWKFVVDVNDCEDAIIMAVEKDLKDKDGVVLVEQYISEMFKNGDLELKRQLAIYYEDYLNDYYEENAKDSFWEQNGYAIERERESDQRDYLEELFKERREL